MRRKREREAPEIGAMAGRVVRALVRRAAEGDTEALEQLLGLQRQVATAVNDAGAELHRFGYTYTELAGVAGITRQAARERFGRVFGEQIVDAGDELIERERAQRDTPTPAKFPTPGPSPRNTSTMGLAQ